MSASQLRQRLHGLKQRTTQNLTQHSFTNANGDEQTSLLGHARNQANSTFNRENQRNFWTRLPRQFVQTSWDVISNSWMNVFLIFVPFGIAAGVVDWPPIAIFVLNFLAIVPLAALLSFATEELAATVGPAVGGLLNATFGNAIELIVSIIALSKDEFRLVQASILGSVLVNILLVLGCCFIAGGIRRTESHYDPTIASVFTSLQTLASSALIVPAILYSSIKNSATGDTIEIVQVSRGTAIVLMVLYIFYLYFQLKTHAGLFRDDVGEEDSEHYSEEDPDPEAVAPAPKTSGREDGDTLGPFGAVVCLVLTTVLVGICAEFLVDSIEDIVESTPLTKTFIGLILLPVVSNAAEHVTAVIVSWKGKMNLALLVDLGSGLQISLFVTPLLVLIAWGMGKELTLHFQLFETIVFFLSVLVVNFLIRGGTSNYLEGMMCVGWYIIIALAIFFYPEDATMA